MGKTLPGQSGVYLQRHGVYTAAPLQHMQCTSRGGLVVKYRPLVFAAYFQPTLQLHRNYTAYLLHFGLGSKNRVHSFIEICLEVSSHHKCVHYIGIIIAIIRGQIFQECLQ